jgi:hypothetical protein
LPGGAGTPEEYAVLPFEDAVANSNYGLSLRSYSNFGTLAVPIATPVVPNQSPGGGDDDDGMSAGVIAGIAIAGAVVLAGGGYYAYSRSGGGDGYSDQQDQPPMFNISANDDVSTIDDPGMRRPLTEREPSVLEGGGYGDQRCVVPIANHCMSV